MDTTNPQPRHRLFKALFVLVTILSAFVVIKAIEGIKEYQYIGHATNAQNYISVTGTGDVLVVPDTGSFSFSVIEEGKTVAEAQDKATTKINDSIAALKALGVDEKDIQTTSYTANPQYDYNAANICTGGFCRPGNPVLRGYEVNQTITVKVRKTADAGTVLSKVGSLGVSNISGLEFVVDDMTAIQAQARDKAIADAKQKAAALSKSLGVALDHIVNFNEVGNEPVYYTMGAQAMDAKVMSAAPQVAPQIPTGQNKVTSTVTITYEVE